jgi:hypothetical protein
MNITNYLANNAPVWLNRGVQMFIQNATRPKSGPPDLVPHYLDRQLALLTEASERNIAKQEEEIEPTSLAGQGHSPISDPDCPYCTIHELTGHARNLLEFAARQCRDDELAPATGGTIPQAQGYIEEAVAIAETAEAEGTMKMLLELVRETGENISPKLNSINTCEEAVEAAHMAERLWLLSAKTAQTYYAGPKAYT